MWFDNRCTCIDKLNYLGDDNVTIQSINLEGINASPLFV